ncbi:MAG: hypothetical protein A2Z92_03655 [Omnitrophica WOR_2 bacterium GWA2_63_20]|nr:MAG: hypothetical protein A2Z92_03655 [Omnitrophica WOR_2 bacterium GWA2_63_20]
MRRRGLQALTVTSGAGAAGAVAGAGRLASVHPDRKRRRLRFLWSRSPLRRLRRQRPGTLADIGDGTAGAAALPLP